MIGEFTLGFMVEAVETFMPLRELPSINIPLFKSLEDTGLLVNPPGLLIELATAPNCIPPLK
jgi:hypothetical protein